MNASPHVLEPVLPAIVHVHATIPAAHPSAKLLGVERMGSGTIIDPAGLILTVSYVVLGAEQLVVTLFDERQVEAELVKYDFASGLALLRIPENPGERLPVLPLRRTAELAVGTSAFVVASVGEGAVRAADGAVSYIGPFEANWEYVLDRAFMTTAMNPGLGGGPLVDLRGRMLGVVSLNLSQIAKFTLAVPVDYYLDAHAAFLVDDGRPAVAAHAWLGVFCYVLNDRIVIAGMVDGGPGEQAGLQPGDVVLAVDGRELADRATLYRHLGRCRPGDAVALRIVRDRAERTVTVAAGDAARYFA